MLQVYMHLYILGTGFLNGDARIQCNDGQWSGRIPTACAGVPVPEPCMYS